jgi:hypothetical protein
VGYNSKLPPKRSIVSGASFTKKNIFINSDIIVEVCTRCYLDWIAAQYGLKMPDNYRYSILT